MCHVACFLALGYAGLVYVMALGYAGLAYVMALGYAGLRRYFCGTS